MPSISTGGSSPPSTTPRCSQVSWALPERSKRERESTTEDEDVFYLLLQKQKIGATNIWFLQGHMKDDACYLFLHRLLLHRLLLHRLLLHRFLLHRFLRREAPLAALRAERETRDDPAGVFRRYKRLRPWTHFPRRCRRSRSLRGADSTPRSASDTCARPPSSPSSASEQASPCSTRAARAGTSTSCSKPCLNRLRALPGFLHDALFLSATNMSRKRCIPTDLSHRRRYLGLALFSSMPPLRPAQQ